jgi:hypothetical protein
MSPKSSSSRGDANMDRGREFPIVVAATLVVAGWACGGDAPSGTRSLEVVDSAGVRVVRNTGPSWEAGEAWLVEADPEWTLGELEGPSETRFFQIEDLVWRSDGGVAVIDGGSAEIRAFGPDGRHLWTQGGEGDGPGEYRSPSTLLLLSGDSIAVYDSRARRISVVGPDGEFVRSVIPEPPEGHVMAAPRVTVGPGVWLSSGGVRCGGEMSASETMTPPMSFFLARPDGTVLDSVLSLPTAARLVQQNERGVSVWTVPFSVDAPVAGGGGRLVTAVPTAPVWTARDSTGRVVQVVSFPSGGRPVRDEDWNAALEFALDGDDDPEFRRTVTEAYEAMERPAEWPILETLILDEEGNVWVEGFQAPTAEGEPSRWWVFTGDGRLLGQVSLPAGLKVRAIARDRIVGVATDELGVERIQLHRIRRPSG